MTGNDLTTVKETVVQLSAWSLFKYVPIVSAECVHPPVVECQRMITIPARTVLNACEWRDIESMREEGSIVILFDLKRVLTIPESPMPQVSVTFGNMVTVRSGDVPVAQFEVDDAEHAEEIAATMSRLLEMT